MKLLIFAPIIALSIVSNAAKLTCTAYSSSRGGTKIIGSINTSNPEQSKFILTASGALVKASEGGSISSEEKLSSLTIAFANRNNNSSEPFIVVGQFEKVDGMDFLFNKPLLSSSGSAGALNVNYMDKDIAINCGQ